MTYGGKSRIVNDPLPQKKVASQLNKGWEAAILRIGCVEHF